MLFFFVIAKQIVFKCQFIVSTNSNDINSKLFSLCFRDQRFTYFYLVALTLSEFSMFPSEEACCKPATIKNKENRRDFSTFMNIISFYNRFSKHHYKARVLHKTSLFTTKNTY